MRLLPIALSLPLLGAALPALADAFVYTDWAVACDNTRRCEAAGFQAETGDSEPVALQLTRLAGPATRTVAVLMAQREDDAKIGLLTITAGTVKVSGIAVDKELSGEQFARLLPELLKASSASVTDGKHSWTLSLAGIKAALLKMDDVQGRVDTQGALVRKGSKPESAALPPLPAPQLRAAPLPKTAAADKKLLAPIIKAMRASDCDEDPPRDAASESALFRLSASRVLVMRLCGRGAYQSDYAFWIANAAPPHAPTQVHFPDDKSTTDSVVSADFSDGVLSSYAKGRGIGDCGASRSWLWTAEGFKLLDAATAPMCRGMAGGVPLRTWVAEQIGKPR